MLRYTIERAIFVYQPAAIASIEAGRVTHAGTVFLKTYNISSLAFMKK